MFARALNRNLEPQRFEVHYICGNHSSVLSRLDRKFQDLDIRRAFTVFQLMTMDVNLASQAMSDAAKEATVPLHGVPIQEPMELATENGIVLKMNNCITNDHCNICRGRYNSNNRV